MNRKGAAVDFLAGLQDREGDGPAPAVPSPTAHHFTGSERQFTFTCTLHRRKRMVQEVTAKRVHCGALRGHRRALHWEEGRLARTRLHGMNASRQTVEVSSWESALDFRQADVHLSLKPEAWRERGVLARLVRHALRCGQVTDQTLQALRSRWHWREALRGGLRTYPLVFVDAGEGDYRLTPWVRWDVKFRPDYAWSSQRGFYEREATRFWVQQGRVPSAREEWHVGVRQQVAEALRLQAVPPYFAESHQGSFVQHTPLGRRTFRLVVDLLPEGKYFTLLGDHGDVTYSVDGRAFLMEDPQGVSVVTAMATLRLREALLWPPDQAGLVWHQVGVTFRRSCQAAQIKALPLQR